MIGHVTLITKQLFVWILLDATNLAVTRAAGDIWIIFAVLTLRAIGPFKKEYTHFKKIQINVLTNQ